MNEFQDPLQRREIKTGGHWCKWWWFVVWVGLLASDSQCNAVDTARAAASYGDPDALKTN